VYRGYVWQPAMHSFAYTPYGRRTVAAEQFFRKILDTSHMTLPCVITADKNLARPPAFEAFQHDRMPQEICRLRQCKCLNNILKKIDGLSNAVSILVGVWDLLHGAADHPGL
jgi:hypothetical protein